MAAVDTKRQGEKLSIFIPINKIDEEQRLVYGEVASETPDNAGETFDYDGSKPYFQKWSDNAYATSGGKSHGNLRVMHTSKVAGIVSSPLGFDDDQKIISACTKVVDDDEWKKVLAGAYTGFSMGGRYVQRITKGTEKRYVADPVEISLVDKPCIPTATFEVIKADGTSETHNFSEDLWVTEAEDLAKASGKGGGPARVPAGSAKGGQFASKGGARMPGETNRQAYDRHQASEYQANAAKARADHKEWSGKNPKASPKEQVDHYRSREKHYDGERQRNYSKGRKEADARDKAERAEARAKARSTPKSDPTGHGTNSNGKAVKPVGKADSGDKIMREPTNDEMLTVATELAKADGKTGGMDWLDYMPQAREQLIAKFDAEALADEDGEPEAEAAPETDLGKADGEEHNAELCKADDCDKCAAAKADSPFAKDKKDGEDEDADDKSKDAKEGDKGDDEGGEKSGKKEDEEGAEKSDAPELEQGWRAKDGTFHVRKADAVTHNVELAKAAAAEADQNPLMSQLQALGQQADAILKGDEGEELPIKDDVEAEPAATKADIVLIIADPLAKLQDFAGNELVKGMYGIQRLSAIMESLQYLHSSVTYEAAAEGDGSPLPGQLLESLKGLGSTLVTMASEEVAELIACATKCQGENIAMSDSGLAADVIVELGASTLGLEKSAFAEQLQKRDVPAWGIGQSDALAKAEQVAAEAVAKADKLQTDFDAMGELVKTIAEKMDMISKLPMPKAPTTSFAKSDVTTGGAAPDGGLAIDLTKFTPAQLTDAAIRLSQQHGRHFVLPQQGQ